MVVHAQTFRTEVPIQPLSHAPLLRHQDPLLLLGSCFSEGVGGRLQAAGHDALANPLGTLFSPASIRRATELLADGPAASWDPPRLDERSGLWYTFDAGASITHPTRTGCEAAMAKALAAGHSQLRRSSCLFVTLGSAWGYAHDGRVVANCHKQPRARWRAQFERALCGVPECAEELRRCVHAARAVGGEGMRVVLTVSPVRHWREGAVESSRSKAHLLAAAHEVAGGVAGVDYFPAYELLMDELRDYRWYAEDMLHPSPAAVDFIFDRLLTACFSAADAPLRAEVGKLRRAAAHRPLHPDGDGARTFAAAQLAQAAELVQRHPHLEAPLAETVAHFRAIGDAWTDEGQIPRETEG